MASLWEKIRSAVAQLPGLAAFWLKAFSQETIDLSLRTHAGLVTRIVERPGLSLAQAELDELVITPRHRQSDTTVRHGPITKQGSKLVRWAAIEAAQKLRRDSGSTPNGNASPNDATRAIAKTAIARKLITLIYTACATASSAASSEPHDPRSESRSGCARVVCHDPRSRRGRPLDCVHLIAAEEHHAPQRGAEMTDTPGTPGENPCRTHLARHHNPRQPDPSTIRSMTRARPSQGLAYGETPLDKPRSFRDDKP